MQLGRLDHVNIRTTRPDEMTRWYERVLGMTVGERPRFPFPGVWLFADGHAAVHLVGIEKDLANTEPRIEHFAFQATGMRALVERLKAAGEHYELWPVPGTGILQVNVWDPDGNHIHIDFRAREET